MHAYHDALPGYHPDQLLHDGCDECEERGKNVELALAHLDGQRFERAWHRAAQWQRHGCDNISRAEIDLLKLLWAIQVKFEQRGIRIGDCPTGVTV